MNENHRGTRGHRGASTPRSTLGRRRLLTALAAVTAGGAAWAAGPGTSAAAPPPLDGETDPLSVHLAALNTTPSYTIVQRTDSGVALLGVNASASSQRGGLLGQDTGTRDFDPADLFGVGGADDSGDTAGVGTWGRSVAGIGIWGLGNAGVGVKAESSEGTALQVLGRSTFSADADFAGNVKGRTLQGDGHRLVSLNASNLGLGTVPDARLSSNVPLKNAPSNAFTGQLSAAGFTGPGAGLSSLNASSLSTGTVPDARQSKNVALKNAQNNTFKGQVIARVFAGAPRTGGAPAFAKAGIATIAKGQDRVLVTTAALKRGVSVVATLQASAGRGVAIEHVERHAGGFDIVLTAPAKTKAQVAYFLFRQG